MTQTWAPIPASVQRARLASLICYFGLFGLFTGKAIVNLLSGVPATVVVFLWLVAVMPLSIFLPGLRRNNSLRTYAWLCFLILMYFLHAVTIAFTTGTLFYGMVYSVLCVALFCALVVYIRLAKKYLGMSLLR
ncbi:MAG: DUF2069 domain-containing protein [Pseudohongiella sp.]|nr:DUF2069 domain-containing protein [Pseudohongiella sp.]MDP3517437.1 DUF2069 domain-containing protein [Pseudohongiella sp.]